MAHADDSSMLASTMEECIQACLDCHASCLWLARHCPDLGDEDACAELLTLLLDCADACRTAANFMLRDSPAHGRLCALCAELCRECERACRAEMDGAEWMRRCADACRRCADACDRMLAGGRPGAVAA